MQAMPQAQGFSALLPVPHAAVASLFWLTKQKTTTQHTKHTTLNTIWNTNYTLQTLSREQPGDGNGSSFYWTESL